MQQSKWRTILQKTIRDPQELFAQLGLDAGKIRLAEQALTAFSLRVPDAYLRRIRHGDPQDPLLRQILPVAEEDAEIPGYTHDPLQEHASQPVPGLLHKYHGRALLIVTGACAIHCRYCFRRHFPYGDASATPQQWQEALDYLHGDTDITEIILSGGDPLTLDNDKLARHLEDLSAITHLLRLRIHTRMPTVLPERIDDDLPAILAGTRLHPVVVVHTNHPREIGAAAAGAVAKLREARILLLNQSVLLRGINDSVSVLQELSEKLFSIGVLPYYLHMLDPVRGTAHFAVSETRAMEIMAGLRAILPGYLVPRLVRELAGHDSKIPVETPV